MSLSDLEGSEVRGDMIKLVLAICTMSGLLRVFVVLAALRALSWHDIKISA